MLSKHELRHVAPWFRKGYLDGYRGEMTNVHETVWGSKSQTDYEAGYVKGSHDRIIDGTRATSS